MTMTMLLNCHCTAQPQMTDLVTQHMIFQGACARPIMLWNCNFRFPVKSRPVRPSLTSQDHYTALETVTESSALPKFPITRSVHFRLSQSSRPSLPPSTATGIRDGDRVKRPPQISHLAFSGQYCSWKQNIQPKQKYICSLLIFYIEKYI